MSITSETRRESLEKLDSSKRRHQVLHTLFVDRYIGAEVGLTASQVARELYARNQCCDMSRNNAAPRLTELSKLGLVKAIGKRKNDSTGRNEAVYQITQTGVDEYMKRKLS